MSNKIVLFSYGSLQKQEVQLSLYKRVLKGNEDQLKGFKLAKKLLYDQYPIIIETKDNTDLISGFVFEITLKELKFTDEYEGEHYRRIQVKLESGREAWCYVM
ncbi:gamma-glutamylcyclotransferase family protein [Cellulophaga tyrosinoxydans]|uniref:Uncharacterized conserved protein YtfP, gamma-glutamylcyclotransferase (GGCT)/AIG2-like family n=1 Tax=Cellulophaga tyrosinoxydans TaxID=504486 RepID=A0A1W1YHQ1_9FLAO|nr:gamma-glutamylcyclotransferase family protein [Cellulophaga tyrosinoxydans]SMC35705.1 Uncharacterized conserved protein YtfP, gamma-glutamylcyclotransferase (GGCT)/AIG2-like family [Cellulophaga tyrosinoxydans]